MKTRNKIFSVIILTIVLAIISFICAVKSGSKYTATVILPHNAIISDENIEIRLSKENIVKIVDKKFVENQMILTFESINKGKTHVEIESKAEEITTIFSLYVHDFGIITYNSFFGDSTNSVVFSVSTVIILIYIELLIIDSYKNMVKENMYSYKNITYLGLIIFLGVTIVDRIYVSFQFRGIEQLIRGAVNMFSAFSIIFLPIAFVVSILVTISNIILVKKEGLNIKNLLGVILGIFFILLTLFPDWLYEFISVNNILNIHDENSIERFIYEFIEMSIYATIAYLECILLGTIILSIKAAKHIPKFDKDYIIILGCQIKKDGTLTNLLKGRVDRAIEFSKMQMENSGKEIVFVPSGGKGSDEIIPEGQAIKNYLLEQGIKEEKILLEDKSKNTYENIKFSNELINAQKENAKIAFSTTNYHVFRAGTIATEQGIIIEGIGSKTKRYFWINAFIREFIATIVSEKRMHIFIFGMIMLTEIIFIQLLYLATVL